MDGRTSADRKVVAFLRAGSDRISGKLGGRVYRDVGGGDIVVAAAPGRSARQSPAQAAQRARMDVVLAAWAGLPLETLDRWRRYADGLPAKAGGRTRRAGGCAVFRSLALKYLAVHGGRAVPSEPPTGAFFGDGLTVRVAGAVGDEPALVFSADFPNTPGVLTELVVQRLPARHCLPKARDYRTAAYVGFAGEGVAVPCRKGAYACAVRFVRAATGQATAMLPIGMVEV